MGLTGGWYGAKTALTATLQPFLKNMPAPEWSENHGNGTYIDSAKFLGDGSLSTTNPDITDNFYAKSLMTPASVPMTEAATVAYMKYLANDGFTTSFVCICGSLPAIPSHLLTLGLVQPDRALRRYQLCYQCCYRRRHLVWASELALHHSILRDQHCRWNFSQFGVHLRRP
jgi:hypothetical protein